MYSYAIHSPELPGRFKLGRSADPQRRLADLQSGSPMPLEIACQWGEETGVTEKALHAAFADRRLHNEWFAVSGDELAVVAVDRGRLAVLMELPTRELGRVLAITHKSRASDAILRLLELEPEWFAVALQARIKRSRRKPRRTVSAAPREIDWPDTIAETLRKAARKRGETPYSVAKTTRASYSTVHAWWNGGSLRTPLASKIADMLGLVLR